ncbi:MAG: helix-turn-helix transcriptional regulator [Bacteroidota bacterium]
MEWTPDRVKGLRKHLGLTQEQFAEKLGYQRRGTISDFEGGRHEPNPQAQIILTMLADQSDFQDEQ